MWYRCIGKEPSRVSLLHIGDRHSPRSSSILARSSTPSPTGPHTFDLCFGNEVQKQIFLGPCAMDIKVRSKAVREIPSRLVLSRLVNRARGPIGVEVLPHSYAPCEASTSCSLGNEHREPRCRSLGSNPPFPVVHVRVWVYCSTTCQ